MLVVVMVLAFTQAAVVEPELLPVTLPDLSGMQESVQQQLQDAYTRIQRTSPPGSPAEQAARSPRVERSEAYGALGKQLMAARYLDVAERCFRNAQLDRKSVV